MDKPPLEIVYDKQSDVVTINGTQYHADLFREFGIKATPRNQVHKILSKEDGVVCIKVVQNQELSDKFDELSNNPI